MTRQDGQAQQLYLAAPVLVALIGACIWWIDTPVAHWMHLNVSTWMLSLGRALDYAGQSQWVLSYCVLVALVTWRTRRHVATDHLWWFSAVAASGIIANIIKVIAGRPRPPLAIESGIVAWDPLAWHVEFLWNSFPSGHATTGLCIAIMGSALYPRLSWFFWPLGVSIALARIILNVHYVSDVLTGSLIGAAVAIMMKRRVTSDSNSPGPWPGDE